jgi:isoquinoline 1-oxidoreductase subunit beta
MPSRNHCPSAGEFQNNVSVEYVHDDPGIPLGFWRSVAFSQNVFCVECFIDEIAALTGRDPLELRLAMLQGSPRLRKVLKMVGEKANWRKTRSEKLHQGLAAYYFHGTKLAAVAEITVDQTGRIHVHRVICAVDCGVAVHPRIVEDQIAGGIAFGLTATLKSRITLTRGAVDQSNFHDFRLLRMNEMPAVEVHTVPGNRPPTGIGESAVPLIGPAVANAAYAATGKRIRHLPIYPQDLVA